MLNRIVSVIFGGVLFAAGAYTLFLQFTDPPRHAELHPGHGRRLTDRGDMGPLARPEATPLTA